MKGEPMAQTAGAPVPDANSGFPRPSEFVARALRWWRRIVPLPWRAPRRLHLCENLPLGDRRFVALVECEGSRFLLGGTSTSLVLLARLEGQNQTARTVSPQPIGAGEEAY